MIGIYGDSFADLNPAETHDRKKEILPWALWLGEFLNSDIQCHARSGTSLWFSYTQFLQTYKNYDTIVFCYTNYMRWNGLSENYKSLSNIRHIEDVKYLPVHEQEKAKFLVQAFEFMYNDDLNKFIYQQIFQEVNKLCKQSNITLINLFPFENTKFYDNLSKSPLLNLQDTHGLCLTGLLEISVKESESSKKLHERLNTKNDVRHCHINSFNNKSLANIIVDNIHTTNYIKLPNLDCFQYDDIYLNHTFNYD
jgi:hypothetical protein